MLEGAHIRPSIQTPKSILRYNIGMKPDKKARLKSGVIAGLLASSILVGVIWSFGYMTGYRLGLPLLPLVAIIVGIVSGAQAYAVDPEDQKQEVDPTLALLQAKEEERARKRT
jgi:hypothetical protein